jgi:two-component system phosphate regulon response regulator PhoB
MNSSVRNEPKSETQRARILLVEDEADLRDLVRFHLERDGFQVEVVGDGNRGLELALTRAWSAVLLDVMLPGCDGFEICRRLRTDARMKQVPVIFLTSRGQEKDVIDGLNLGADDYLVKPFSLKELAARIRAALRRSGAPTHAAGHRAGTIQLDPLRHEVLLAGEPLSLTATEFRLLHHLMRHAGRAFTRDELKPCAIGEGIVVLDRNIDVHIGNLRKKLGDEAPRISTVRGVGYRFEGD